MEKDVLKKLQLTELEMLKDVAEFCDKNNIRYFLFAGTLIGALRHGGFIPWDDDIDIAMDLKNYRKFLRLAPKGLPQKYFVQHFTTDPKVSIPWIKVRINGTTSMERDLTNFDVHYGICMDIFLMNGISERPFRKKLQVKYAKRQRQMLYKHIFIARNVYNYLPKYVKKLPEFARRVLVRVYELIISVDLSKTSLCYSNAWDDVGEKEHFESKWFLEFDKSKFEDTYFTIPREAEKYLEAQYGDWRTPPPESERGGHGDIIVDFENDFTTYQTFTKKNKNRS